MTKPVARTITLEHVKELIHYDPETGDFRWRTARPGANTQSKVGTVKRGGYLLITLDRENVLAHLLAFFYMTGEWPELPVDRRSQRRRHGVSWTAGLGDDMGKTLWLGRMSVSAGITDRGDNGSNPPWMGFCYGSWLPRMHWNGGRPWRREVVDIGWYWLCFHGSWTWWQGRGNWFWQTPQPKSPNFEVTGAPPHGA